MAGRRRAPVTKGKSMKRSIWIAAGFAAAVACTAAYAAQLKIKNDTLWDIHYLYMSPSDQTEWGPDQLEDDILESGGTLTLNGVTCDTWDIKIVDEDQDECVGGRHGRMSIGLR